MQGNTGRRISFFTRQISGKDTRERTLPDTPRSIIPKELIINILSVILGVLCLSTTGCVSVPRTIIRGETTADGKNRVKTDNEMLASYPKLEKAYRQVKGQFGPLGIMGHATTLPRRFEKNSMIASMVVSTRETLAGRKIPISYISAGDAARTIKMLSTDFGVGLISPSGTPEAGKFRSPEEREIYIQVSRYLYAYFISKDGFIGSDGTQYIAPDIKGKIENSTVTAVTTILLEAILDRLLDTPVWADANGVLQTKENRLPTAVKLGYVTKETLAPKGTPKKIDLEELKLMQYGSSLAGEQSKLLSGLAFRFLGKANIGFGIEGGFSFGDNETVAKALDAFFETNARRITMESLRRLYLSHLEGGLPFDPEKAQAIELIMEATKK